MDDSSADPSFYVIKDSGDDPDVTNGAGVYVSVRRITDAKAGDAQNRSAGIFTDEDHPGICLAGGEGVGLVFKSGEILRKVPQEALLDELKKELDNWE